MNNNLTWLPADTNANEQHDKTEIPENHWAALDIGSNSFHFVYVRERGSQLQILHREKYPVQLASGLDSNNLLSDEAIAQGIAVLKQLAVTCEHITPERFRAVATYTLRKAINAKAFLIQAKKVFPFDIEIISGHEEARLIYQGVAFNHANRDKRLVIDIGGGSTECIIGQDYHAYALASVSMGCVSYKQRFFSTDEITTLQFNLAIKAAKIEMESMVKRFKSISWQIAIGTSGTIKTLFNIIAEQKAGITENVTLGDLHQLKHQLIELGNVQHLSFAGLKEKRRTVLCSGLAILIASFEMLAIEAMEYCDYSLRDGVLSELIELDNNKEVRQRAIDSLQQRFSVDLAQVTDVSLVAKTMFDGIKKTWQLSGSIYEKLLLWAIQVHEIGLDINPSGYHRHGEYILQNSDLAGFNQEQQLALSWLVGNQRKKISPLNVEQFNVLLPEKLYQLLAIMRLAVLLQQQRALASLPDFTATASDNSLVLAFDQTWLSPREILAEELHNEIEQLNQMDISIKLAE
jgi:exopolyphosphatase/guanosine-5'-triphosphate,3'-diphosphate pyrophosphatase